MESAYIILSRLQFGLTASFHIIFPCMVIGFSFYLLLMEIFWLKTKHPIYKTQYQFWVKPFAGAFILAILTGVVLSYQLDTLFKEFYYQTADVLVPIRKVEFINALLLEAGFLGIMIIGWKRVGNRLHCLGTATFCCGILVAAICILARNSWMQTPAGFQIIGGEIRLTNWLLAVLNPSFPYRFVHMIGAALLSTAMLILGISAWFLLREQYQAFARYSLRVAMLMVVVLAPLQLLSGDLHGLNTHQHQPVKLAAMEGLWETKRGAPLVLFAIPDPDLEKNHFSLEIPMLASLIITHDPRGEIQGLKEVPKQDRPYVPLVFYSFRLMVAAGLLTIAIGLMGLFLLRRQRLYQSRWFLHLCCWATPSGFLATIAGWCVSEAGRQPWVVYGLLRTTDVINPQVAAQVPKSLGVLGVIYAVLLVVFMAYLWRVIRTGPTDDDLAITQTMPTGPLVGELSR